MKLLMLKLAPEFETKSRQQYAGTGALHASEELPSFRPAPHLAAGEAHVWTLWQRPRPLAGYISLLSRDEMDRANRFHTPQLFDRFVADHGALRLLLSAYLETDPRKLSFATNKYGKPRLENPFCRLRFNMSHSGEITMIAVCLDAEIGIDVEVVRRIEEWEEIAASHFSKRENETLNAELPEQRMEAFFRCWTRKEALIKAIGMGLSIPLDSFTVTTSLSEPAALLDCTWDGIEASRWSLLHLEPGTGHVGALAIEHQGWSTQHFTWPDGERGPEGE